MKLLYCLLCYRYQGYISAALVLGGVDVTGPHLYSVYPHGSTDALPYVTMGSGSLAAMSVFEDRYKINMEVTSCAHTHQYHSVRLNKSIHSLLI